MDNENFLGSKNTKRGNKDKADIRSDRKAANHEIRQGVTGGYKRFNKKLKTNAGPTISLKDGK
jgi:hypothetical protein